MPPTDVFAGMLFASRSPWAVATMLMILFGGCGTPTGTAEPAADVPPSFTAAVQTGDLVMRRGRSVASLSVLLSDGAGAYSHAGVAIRRGDSVWVVHAAPRSEVERGFVVREPLAVFLAGDRADAAALYRSGALDGGLRDSLAAVLERDARSRLPFDGDFDLRTPERVYCTELVWRAFRSAGIELLPRGVASRSTPLGPRRVVLPSDLAAGPDVRQVTTFARPAPVRRGLASLFIG